MNHDELAFIAELASVNQDLARHLGRVLDIDRGLTGYNTALADAERELATRLFSIAQALEANAAGRSGEADKAVVVEGMVRVSDAHRHKKR